MMNKRNTSGTISPNDRQAQRDFDDKMAFLDSIDIPSEDDEVINDSVPVTDKFPIIDGA